MLLAATLTFVGATVVASAASGSARGSGTAPAAAQARRPNILWLQTDSMDGRLFDPTSPMYQKLLLSGFKKRVTEHAFTFARHYTNSPQCVPSRTSLMTGRYVHETGTTNNGQGIARNTATGGLDSNCVSTWNASQCEEFAAAQGVQAQMLDYLRQGGYKIHPFGRFDAGAGILDQYPDTTSGDGFHGGPAVGILLRGAAIPGASKPEPLKTTETGNDDPYGQDERHTKLALEFLRDTSPPGPTDPPALVWLGIIAPHPPYDTNHTYIDQVNASAIDTPPTLPDGLYPYEAAQSLLKGLQERTYTEDEQKRMRKAYWGAAAQATDMLRKVLDEAERAGWLENAIVVITSDHGEMSLEHGQDYKNSLLEPSARVPLLIMPVNVTGIPALPNGGLTVTAPTSHIDLLPTLLDLAGVPQPAELRGTSLMPYLKRSVAPGQPLPLGKPYVAMEYHSNLAPGSAFGLVLHNATGTGAAFKLITYGHSLLPQAPLEPQLFDITSDGFELRDVSKKHPELVTSMRATLEEEFGGPGSLQAIDTALKASNVDVYGRWFQAECSPAELLKRLQDTFKGAEDRTIHERTIAWTGLDPRKATGGGPGTRCPRGRDGLLD